MNAVNGIVTDEVSFLQSLVPLEGTTLLELGCGKAEFTRRLLAKTKVNAITALEVDRIQHRLNLESARDPRLAFGFGGAEEIPCDDATFDGVMMMKSLHHAPIASLPRVFSEIRRVLKPGGWAYISEPVYGGALNDVIKLFHDEGLVRAAALKALEAAVTEGILKREAEHFFDMPTRYTGFDDFSTKHLEVTHSERNLTPQLLAEVRAAFEQHMTPAGADFTKPMHVNLLRKQA